MKQFFFFLLKCKHAAAETYRCENTIEIICCKDVHVQITGYEAEQQIICEIWSYPFSVDMCRIRISKHSEFSSCMVQNATL